LFAMSEEFVSCERVEAGGAFRVRAVVSPTAARLGALLTSFGNQAAWCHQLEHRTVRVRRGAVPRFSG